MPSLELGLSVNKYDTSAAYLLGPDEFEMQPKIDASGDQKCALGLWNLGETNRRYVH